jgi:hypothetical protein
LNIYIKYFINDKTTTQIIKGIDTNICFEIADYQKNNNDNTDGLNSKKFIREIDNNKKIYHSMNKHFFIINYYGKDNSKFIDGWKEYFVTEFEYSSSINCNKIIIHFINGALPNTKEKIKLLIKNNKEASDYLVFLSKKYNIKIYFENSFERGVEEFNLFIKYLNEEYKDFDYGICFDIGHQNVWGNYESNFKEWIEYIEKSKKDIHYHIHVNNSLQDNHQSLLYNSTNEEYKEIFQNLKYLVNKNIMKNLTLEVDNVNFEEDMLFLRNIKS